MHQSPYKTFRKLQRVQVILLKMVRPGWVFSFSSHEKSKVLYNIAHRFKKESSMVLGSHHILKITSGAETIALSSNMEFLHAVIVAL